MLLVYFIIFVDELETHLDDDLSFKQHVYKCDQIAYYSHHIDPKTLHEHKEGLFIAFYHCIVFLVKLRRLFLNVVLEGHRWVHIVC